MKFIIVLTLLFAIVSCVSYRNYFEAFKRKYNKQYTAEEEAIRYKVFVDNAKFIEDFNKQNRSYQVAVNEFADLTNAEFQSKFLRPIQPKGLVGEHKSGEHKSGEHKSGDLPTSIDWRTETGNDLKINAVTSVKNQGDCGSCWAFSTVGALEGCISVSNNASISVNLSVSQFVDCVTKCDGCDGGDMRIALDYALNHTICSEASYPYSPVDGSCKDSTCTKVETITKYGNVISKNETDLANATATYGPVSVGIDASDFSFQFYSTGVYDPFICSQEKLDHGVLVVGYEDNNDPKYWIVKNSWGTGWGKEGYIWMIKDHKNKCGIATEAQYGIECSPVK
jgi:cathepsin L